LPPPRPKGKEPLRGQRARRRPLPCGVAGTGSTEATGRRPPLLTDLESARVAGVREEPREEAREQREDPPPWCARRRLAPPSPAGHRPTPSSLQPPRVRWRESGWGQNELGLGTGRSAPFYSARSGRSTVRSASDGHRFKRHELASRGPSFWPGRNRARSLSAAQGRHAPKAGRGPR
jgi:hypothetical protein